MERGPVKMFTTIHCKLIVCSAGCHCALTWIAMMQSPLLIQTKTYPSEMCSRSLEQLEVRRGSMRPSLMLQTNEAYRRWGTAVQSAATDISPEWKLQESPHQILVALRVWVQCSDRTSWTYLENSISTSWMWSVSPEHSGATGKNQLHVP